MHQRWPMIQRSKKCMYVVNSLKKILQKKIWAYLSNSMHDIAAYDRKKTLKSRVQTCLKMIQDDTANSASYVVKLLDEKSYCFTS